MTFFCFGLAKLAEIAHDLPLKSLGSGCLAALRAVRALVRVCRRSCLDGKWPQWVATWIIGSDPLDALVLFGGEGGGGPSQTAEVPYHSGSGTQAHDAVLCWSYCRSPLAD